MYITKETKWHTCRCRGNSYAVGPVLIKAKIPRFYLKTWVIHSQHTNGESIDDMRTMCVPRKTLCTTCKCCKWRYLLFHRKRLEPRVLPWQHHSKWHFVSFVMYFSGAKFEEHSSNISGDILDSVFYCSSVTIYDVITFLVCIIQKHEYL